MKTLDFHIDGMTCNGCATSLQNALTSTSGIHRATVSYEKKIATVTMETDVEAEIVVQTAMGKGYSAQATGVENLSTDSAKSAVKVVIIGSGAASFSAALRAVEIGASVTIVESGTVGGTCVNVGCVPSKIMIRAAHFAHQQAHHPFPGVSKSTAKVDRAALVAQQQGRVEELRHAKYESILESHPDINLVKGHARFIDGHTVEIVPGDGTTQQIVADRFLVATGRSPSIPTTLGLATTPYWTSTSALIAETLPEHLLVYGGSVVALELAQAFLRLGSKVTLIARSTLLSKEDPAIGNALQAALEAEGMRILTNADLHAVRYEDGLFHLDVGSETLTGHQLLVATGRQPNTGELGLDTAGVKIDSSGAVIIDAHMRTSAPHIYAAGDCTNQPQYVYVAAAAGTRAAINMMGGDAVLDLSALPSVVFTEPQVASVGLTEQQAQRRSIEVDCRTLSLDNVPRALANFNTTGCVFHGKLDTHSTANWTRVPRQTGHAFRAKLDSQSTAN